MDFSLVRVFELVFEIVRVSQETWMSRAVLKISPLALLLGTWGLEFVKKQPGQKKHVFHFIQVHFLQGKCLAPAGV